MRSQQQPCTCSQHRRCLSANHLRSQFCVWPGLKRSKYNSYAFQSPPPPSASQIKRPLPSAATTAQAARQPAAGTHVQVHIFWDLDNIRVCHMGHLPLVARRLLLAVGQLVLPGPGSEDGGPHSRDVPAAERQQHLTAYANEHTLARLGGRRGATGSHDAQSLAARSLALVGGRLVAVPVRRNSADLAMSGDMERLARQLAPSSSSGSGGPEAISCQDGSATTRPLLVLACASNDVGFAPTLRYSAARGLATVAVTDPLRTRRRPPWAPPPDYGRYPLPAAAGRCLAWDDRWLPQQQQADEEAALAQAWAAETGLPLPPLPCAGGVVRAWVQRSALIQA